MSFNIAKILCSVLAFLSFSCSEPNNKKVDIKEEDNLISGIFNLRSVVKATAVSGNYVYCDSTMTGDMSCFIRYNGNKYLKNEKLSFNNKGDLDTVILFKPEGTISFSQKDLLSDSLLMEASGWKISGNIIEISDNHVLKPIFGKILEMQEIQKRIYVMSDSLKKGNALLYVYEYW